MPKKVLIVRTSSLGDIIHTLPVAYDVKQALPDAQLDWLVEESFADVCSLSPSIDTVVKTAFRRWRKEPFSKSTRLEIRLIKARLREAQYDAVIDTQGLLRSAWAASWTKAKTYGYSRDTIREPLASFLYKETRRMPENIGTVRRYRRMVANCLGYPIDEEHPHFALRAPKTLPCTLPQTFASLFVSTSQDRKHWQEARWRELLHALKEMSLDAVLFWGNEKEKDRAERIAAGIPSAHVLPRMPIRDVASVIAKSRIGIGVDTGLMHLAAALAIPCVGIWVDTKPENISLIGEGDCATIGGKGVDVSVESIVQGVVQRIGS